LSDIAAKSAAAGIDRTALILVGRSIQPPTFGESYLYSSQRDRTQA
jgi:precorrin-4/cobalt-precorrin-4 C11-methyltransferase